MMRISRVALIKCDTYDYQVVEDAVERGLNLLGGISSFAKEGEKILLKPNVLIGSNPDKCVCTHPAVFKAVGTIFKKAKADVSYGDSSAFGGSTFNMRLAKLAQVADELGIRLANFKNGKYLSHNKALLNKRFYIAKDVLEADGLISLPKLKTHGLTRITGAVKNQFGCIPGLRKTQFHVKMAEPADFASMLVDLNTLIRPRLYIMDGIIAMEGNGPRSGNPKKIGTLLFSDDPVAMDSIACKIINLNPEYVPTSIPGEMAGLGTYHYENIELLGDDIESVIDKDFNVIRKPVISVSAGKSRKFIRNQTCAKPVINESICNHCGICVTHCPSKPKAVDWHKGDKDRPPTFKYENCIRCYCCQELCPEGAITLREPILGKVFNFIS
jgi:uncharacterized protein (DUF362 family)/Pyruvate/2-oxoacid:ferredoxin oxidoreductase delta subunit